METVTVAQLAHKLKMTEKRINDYLIEQGVEPGPMKKEVSVIVALGICLDWSLTEAAKFVTRNKNS